MFAEKLLLRVSAGALKSEESRCAAHPVACRSTAGAHKHSPKTRKTTKTHENEQIIVQEAIGAPCRAKLSCLEFGSYVITLFLRVARLEHEGAAPQRTLPTPSQHGREAVA